MYDFKTIKYYFLYHNFVDSIIFAFVMIIIYLILDYYVKLIEIMRVQYIAASDEH